MSEQAFLRRFYADRSEIEAMGSALAVERPGDDPFQGDLYALPPENYYLPALDFDEAELSALQTCLYLLEGQFAYAEPLRLALQHLTLGRPSPLDDHAARTVSVNLLGRGLLRRRSRPTSPRSSRRSAGARRSASPTTRSVATSAREREVDPYSLLYSAGNWYVVGFSHERQATRIFRLSRIEGRITFKTRAEHDFPAPQDFDLSRYRDRAPWQLDDAHRDRHHRPHPDHRLVGGADVRQSTETSRSNADGSGRLHHRVRQRSGAAHLDPRPGRRGRSARPAGAARRRRPCARARSRPAPGRRRPPRRRTRSRSPYGSSEPAAPSGPVHGPGAAWSPPSASRACSPS